MSETLTIICREPGCSRTFGSEIGRALHERLLHTEAVPDAALGLPWVHWPSEPAICDGVLERVELAMMRATSDAECRFWTRCGSRLPIASRARLSKQG